MQAAAGHDDEASVRTLHTEELLRTGFSVVRQSTIEYRRRNGTNQRLRRETYDHGNGAGILLYDPTRGCVLLVSQFRFPVYVNPVPNGPAGLPPGWTVEVPAGMVSDHGAVGRSAAEAVRAEVEEEAGIRLAAAPRLIADVFMSPGSVTERVSLFVSTYSTSDRIGPGGGLADEGEDIVIIEPLLDDALAMITSGEIADAKTIMLLYWAALNRTALASAESG